MPKAQSINLKDIHKAIHRSQHCQRNWDLETSMPQEDIDTILESVTQCPSKQNKLFYNVHVLQSRDLIEQLHNLTYGFGLDLDNVTTNSQTLANLVLVFESASTEQLCKEAYFNRHICDANKTPHLDWSTHIFDEDLMRSCREEVRRDEHMAVGVAAGYSNLTASLLGYGTGCCACFDIAGVRNLLNLEGEPLLIMGIGVPGHKPRRVHHLNDNIVFPTKKKVPVGVLAH